MYKLEIIILRVRNVNKCDFKNGNRGYGIQMEVYTIDVGDNCPHSDIN